MGNLRSQQKHVTELWNMEDELREKVDRLSPFIGSQNHNIKAVRVQSP
jgi:hypothetical protein